MTNQYIISINETKLNPRNSPNKPPMVDKKSMKLIFTDFTNSEIKVFSNSFKEIF